MIHIQSLLFATKSIMDGKVFVEVAGHLIFIAVLITFFQR